MSLPITYWKIRPYNFGLLLFAASSCTVYAPMQGTMPLLTAKGQAEFGASIQPIGRVEATAAYSPANHLLLTAGVTGCPKLGTKNFLVTRQYEVGVGGYQKLVLHQRCRSISQQYPKA